ncbi:MAG: chemotaxis response regulator protein-glutamate methylesterase [Robiginitomaculum sp.]|nr:MAG: chemotaxis response regulator protein-glutamate methylesterase [Robiginitomaculum sp.]
MITDDSAVVRGMITRWLAEEDGIEIVAKATDGLQAIKLAAEHQPDVVILDVEMPRLDGLTALPQILKAAPKSKVVMASTLTHRNADITLRALSNGAADYLPKPESSSLAGAKDFRQDLITKVRALGEAGRRAKIAYKRPMAPPARTAPRLRAQVKAVRPAPKAVFIGASTGGPQALRDVITAIGPKINIPVFITQHMPKAFTAVLAEHLSKNARKPVVEGRDGMPVKSNGIYLAPGDFHMTVRRSGSGIVIGLDQRPQENYCRPAVDPMFRSAAEVYNNTALGVILTGMGHDGCAGAEQMVKTGAQIIAQDEASSVVWGMPGSVVQAGLAEQIKPINQIGYTIMKIVSGGKL